ncbi:MAG: class I SAM-dependent methyltransferase [Oscillospiraceae bacterium]|jgi:tRNA (adenine22-N1)-methyltransferase|nr:class I SAM-dependent methyltransferase [Oscillospiraceae bacterium]
MNLRAGGRLAEIASRVPFGARVLDVGCDHGYVPIRLALSGQAAEIYASDIRLGPLGAAVRNAERYGVAERINFYLEDGIPEKLAGLVDTVIIAGMGGETIAGILARAPEMPGGVFFILQPQTKVGVLLAYLGERGFVEVKLAEVYEGRRKYTIITGET